MKKLFLLVFSIALVAIVNAKPAYRGAIERIQEDGSTITVYQHGDEFFHWTTNERGEWLKYENGKYVVVPAMSTSEIDKARVSAKRAPQANQQAAPINLAPHGLIILVNFADVPFDASNSLADMKDMHNGDNYNYEYSYTVRGYTYNVKATGSARKYFIDQSNGNYKPTFDVVGPYTLSKERSYYGDNDSRGNDKHPEEMVQEACKLADADVDFSIYDNDSDGKVDFVYIIYAGYGEADGGGEETIWPHSYHLTYSGVLCKVDEKQVDLYACGSELSYSTKHRDGIGTFCHEFSHVLGLPDIYSTNNGSWKTSGAWDIMDYGPYNNDGSTPPAYSGYERMFFGWVTPRVLGFGEHTITELQANNDVCVITATGEFNGIGSDPDPSTFWVLENRQQYLWDEYLPGHGMLITKIMYDYNTWKTNVVNNTKSALCIDIQEADGKTPSYNASFENGYYGKEGDAYPAGGTSYVWIPNRLVNNVVETNQVISLSVTYTEGIEELHNEDSSSAIKTLQNGQVVIKHNGSLYNLLGSKIE